jgi:hypothetical protein
LFFCLVNIFSFLFFNSISSSPLLLELS